MNRQIKIIEESSATDFEKKINTEIINGWAPHWETFKVLEGDNFGRFYILLEKKLEDI